MLRGLLGSPGALQEGSIIPMSTLPRSQPLLLGRHSHGRCQSADRQVAGAAAQIQSTLDCTSGPGTDHRQPPALKHTKPGSFTNALDEGIKNILILLHLNVELSLFVLFCAVGRRIPRRPWLPAGRQGLPGAPGSGTCVGVRLRAEVATFPWISFLPEGTCVKRGTVTQTWVSGRHFRQK